MIRSYLKGSDGTMKCGLSFEEMRTAIADEKITLWVDAENLQDNEIEMLLEVFSLHPLTVEDCIMPNIRPKLEEFDHYLFIILQGMCRQRDGGLQSVELDLCLGKNFLITVRSGRVNGVEDVAARVERKSPIFSRGACFLFYVITDSLIEGYLPIIEEVEDYVDELEVKLLSDSSEKTLRKLLDVYHDIITLRRALVPHREIVSRLNRGDLSLIMPTNSVYFRDVYDHLLRMSDLVDACREVTTMTLDAHSTLASNRLNEIMKTMTACATLALPLILVTGIFGMNFGENPGLGPRWIYYSVSAILAAAVPVMLILFRRYKWL